MIRTAYRVLSWLSLFRAASRGPEALARNRARAWLFRQTARWTR